jgi:bHLH factor
MQEINDAFRELRSVIPELPEDADERSDEYSDNASCSSKLTKITTLRLAVNYIAALSDILKQTDPPSAHAEHDSCTSGPPPPLAPGLGQDTSDAVLSSLSLDLELETLTSGDFPLTDSQDDVRDAELRLLIENSFGRGGASDTRPASGNSYDLSSYHSPSTTETESIESMTGSSGWEFASTEETSLGDVCESFDLMLESDGDGVAASY